MSKKKKRGEQNTPQKTKNTPPETHPSGVNGYTNVLDACHVCYLHYTNTWIEGKMEIRMDGRSAELKQEDCRHFDMIPYDLAFALIWIRSIIK